MSPPWLTRIVLALALAVLPLQGLAETVQLFLCQSQSGASAQATADGPSPHDVATDHGHRHTHAGADHVHENGHAPVDEASPDVAAMDEAPGDGHAGHFCCDVVVAALTGSASSVAASDFPALEPAREVFHGSVFLEYPQRPPLA